MKTGRDKKDNARSVARGSESAKDAPRRKPSMFPRALIDKFKKIPTPFYYYDTALLRKTLEAMRTASKKYDTEVHYALKANANVKILKIIRGYGFGADCVSGNEVRRAIECGFLPSLVVFAGVGKSDEEITHALKKNIGCFNCESTGEIKVINALANKLNKKATISIRINPNVNAHTHQYITTGLEENKFGINVWELPDVLHVIAQCRNINLTGLHFHIGSQVTDIAPFKSLCLKVNELQQWFESRHIYLTSINIGGGLGIDYYNPDKNAVPDFDGYLGVFMRFLNLRRGQTLHCEPGRALIAQCGTLVSRVLFVKNGRQANFIILDAGMTELIRPALYQSYHKIENLTGTKRNSIVSYDVTGPICESSDCFGKAIDLPVTERGDILIIRSAGAYGESMALDYNLRDRAKSFMSTEI